MAGLRCHRQSLARRTQPHALRRLVATILIFSLWLISDQPQLAHAQSAAQIVDQVNAFRASLGLPPFTYNAQLAVAAQQQAQYIAETNNYSHTGYGGSTPQSRANAAGYNGRATENIVGGSRMTPAQGLSWWQNSSVHYATITSAHYTEIGGGFASGSSEQNIYAIVVGRPNDAPPPATGGGIDVVTAAPPPIRAPRFIMAAPNDDGSIIHEVKTGQALWTIAAYYEVEIPYLLRINNLKEGDFVNPGDQIVVELAEGVPTPTPLPSPTPPYEHTVREGQTLWSIATFHDLELEELLYLNSIDEEAIISPGDELIVRLRPGQAPPPTATPTLMHTVQTGHTLLGIALRYNLPLADLLTLNNLTENSLIQPGDQLLVRQPQSGELPTATPTATVTLTPTTPVDPAATMPPTVVVVAPTVTPSVTFTPSAEPQIAAVTSAETPTPIPGSEPKVIELNQSPLFQNMLLLGLSAAASGMIGLWLVVRRK